MGQVLSFTNRSCAFSKFKPGFKKSVIVVCFGHRPLMENYYPFKKCICRSLHFFFTIKIFLSLLGIPFLVLNPTHPENQTHE